MIKAVILLIVTSLKEDKVKVNKDKTRDIVIDNRDLENKSSDNLS